MKLAENLKLLQDTMRQAKSPLQLGYPSLLLLSTVILFFLLLWFVFAPRINNALVDLVEIGKQIQTGTPDVTLQLSFDTAMGSLFTVLFWFIITVFFLWCIFGGFFWKWIGSVVKKTPPSFLFSFSLLSLIYTLFSIIIGLPLVRLSFFFPSHGQLIILTTIAAVLGIALHFLHIAYVGLLLEKSWKQLLGSFSVGVANLPMLLWSYLLIGSILVAYEFFLRLIAVLSMPLYLAIAITTLFPLLVLLEVYLVRVTLVLWKEYRQ